MKYLLKFEGEIPTNEGGHMVKGFEVISQKEFDLLNENSEKEIDFSLFEDDRDDMAQCVIAGEEEIATIQDYLDMCDILELSDSEYNVFKKFKLLIFGKTYVEDIINQCGDDE